MRRPKPSEFDQGDGNGIDYDTYDERMSEFEDTMYQEHKDREDDVGDQIHEERKQRDEDEK